MNNRKKCYTAVALLLLSLVSGAIAPSFRYEREVKVPESGWVGVQLPLEVLLKLSSGMNDWQLVDPDGNPFPAKIWTRLVEPPASAHEASVYNIKSVPGGWLVEADLGASAPRHRRAIVNLPGAGLAENISVEGSNDGEFWRLLAKGAFFRLKPGSHIEKTWLDYDPVNLRYIRIFWPKRAGMPKWQSVRVEDWPDGVLETINEPLSATSEAIGPYEAGFDADLPVFPMRDALLGIRAELKSPVRLTVLNAANGSWKVVAEAILGPDRNKAIFLPGSLKNGSVRLVVDSEGYPLPEIKGFYLRYPPRSLVFMADKPGTYILRYGGAPGYAMPRALPGHLKVPGQFDTSAILGEEREIQLPDLPAKSLGLGGVLPQVRFSERWVIKGSETPPDKFVSVQLPPEIYASARRDLGDLRLAADDRQIPYILYVPPDGRQVLRLKGLFPSPGEKPKTSVLDFSVKNPNMPLTCLTLTVPSAPFARQVVLQAKGIVHGGNYEKRDSWTTIRSVSWTCPGVSELPSRLNINLYTSAATKYRLVFYDGDNAPLSPVDLTLWSNRHLLIFPWPGGAEISLYAGAPKLTRPVYDLASLRGQLLKRKFAVLEAVVSTSEYVTNRKGSRELFSRKTLKMLFVVLLCLACLLLLAIVVKTVKEVPPPKKE